MILEFFFFIGLLIHCRVIMFPRDQHPEKYKNPFWDAVEKR